MAPNIGLQRTAAAASAAEAGSFGVGRFVGVRLLALLSAVGISGIPRSALGACDCRPAKEVSEAFSMASSVFIGVVRHIEPAGDCAYVTFKIFREWGLADQPLVRLYVPNADGCGFDFTRGGAYLVYAKRVLVPAADGSMTVYPVTSRCTRTSKLGDAAADVTELVTQFEEATVAH